MLSSTLLATLASLSALVVAAPTPNNWGKIDYGGTYHRIHAADTSNILPSPDPLVVFDNGVSFSYTPDGAVTMRLPDGTVDWTNGVSGHSCGADRCALQFQGDGNLAAVDYDTPDAYYWATGTTASDDTPQGWTWYIVDSRPYLTIYSEDDDLIWSSGD